MTDQPAFLNAVVAVETALPPLQALARLKAAERDLGRQVRYRNGPREVDLDLLYLGDERVEEDEGRERSVQARGPHVGVVVQVFDGMHAEARKRLGVGVAVVERVDVLVESADVREAVHNVKVCIAPARRHQH